MAALTDKEKLTMADIVLLINELNAENRSRLLCYTHGVVDSQHLNAN